MHTFFFFSSQFHLPVVRHRESIWFLDDLNLKMYSLTINCQGKSFLDNSMVTMREGEFEP